MQHIHKWTTGALVAAVGGTAVYAGYMHLKYAPIKAARKAERVAMLEKVRLKSIQMTADSEAKLKESARISSVHRMAESEARKKGDANRSDADISKYRSAVNDLVSDHLFLNDDLNDFEVYNSGTAVVLTRPGEGSVIDVPAVRDWAKEMQYVLDRTDGITCSNGVGESYFTCKREW